MSCCIYTYRVYTDIKAPSVINQWGKNKPVRHLVCAYVFKFVFVCLHVIKQYSSTRCCAQEVAMIHFLFGWKSHLFHELPRVLPHTNAHGLERKYMEEQTHAHTKHHPVYFSLSCIVTWAQDKYKLFVLSPAQQFSFFFSLCLHVLYTNQYFWVFFGD